MNYGENVGLPEKTWTIVKTLDCLKKHELWRKHWIAWKNMNYSENVGLPEIAFLEKKETERWSNRNVSRILMILRCGIYSLVKLDTFSQPLHLKLPWKPASVPILLPLTNSVSPPFSYVDCFRWFSRVVHAQHVCVCVMVVCRLAH